MNKPCPDENDSVHPTVPQHLVPHAGPPPRHCRRKSITFAEEKSVAIFDPKSKPNHSVMPHFVLCDQRFQSSSAAELNYNHESSCSQEKNQCEEFLPKRPTRSGAKSQGTSIQYDRRSPSPASRLKRSDQSTTVYLLSKALQNEVEVHQPSTRTPLERIPSPQTTDSTTFSSSSYSFSSDEAASAPFTNKIEAKLEAKTTHMSQNKNTSLAVEDTQTKHWSSNVANAKETDENPSLPKLHQPSHHSVNDDPSDMCSLPTLISYDWDHNSSNVDDASDTCTLSNHTDITDRDAECDGTKTSLRTASLFKSSRIESIKSALRSLRSTNESAVKNVSRQPPICVQVPEKSLSSAPAKAIDGQQEKVASVVAKTVKNRSKFSYPDPLVTISPKTMIQSSPLARQARRKSTHFSNCHRPNIVKKPSSGRCDHV